MFTENYNGSKYTRLNLLCEKNTENRTSNEN